MIDPDSTQNQKIVTDRTNYENAVNQCLVLRDKLNESV